MAIKRPTIGPPEGCFPSPFCRCCVCKGKHCLISHPGHSHMYPRENFDFDFDSESRQILSNSWKIKDLP